MTMTIVEFLTARVDEREAQAKAASEGPWRSGDTYGGHVSVEAPGWTVAANMDRADADLIAANDPAYVLADVAAKRAIIAAAFEDGATIDSEWGCCHDPEAIRRACMEADGLDCYGVKHAEAAMKLLIQPFADHPDFNPTWRV